MRNLIYQFWNGNMPYYAKVSAQEIKKYADYIGADHRVDINKPFMNIANSSYMNCLLPIYDSYFAKYDNVLFLDMDIFPTDMNRSNIFEQDVKGIGMVREPLQPELREQSKGPINSFTDKMWATRARSKFGIQVPVDEQDRPLVFNSGVVYYTAEARENAKEWVQYNQYVEAVSHLNRFYHLDQNYLGMMVHSGKTEFTEMDIKWNSQVHYTGDKTPRDVIDNRVEDTVFVHLQTRPRDILNDDMIYDIVNKPVDQWRHR